MSNEVFIGYPDAALGDCVRLDTSTTAGLWYNVKCDAQLPSACTKTSEFGFLMTLVTLKYRVLRKI